MHMFASASHPPGVALAEELLRIAPVPMAKVFFANSGSEAVDSAVKMIWYFNNALGRVKEEKDYCPSRRVPWLIDCFFKPDWTAKKPQTIRSSASGVFAYRQTALLPVCT